MNKPIQSIFLITLLIFSQISLVSADEGIFSQEFLDLINKIFSKEKDIRFSDPVARGSKLKLDTARYSDDPASEENEAPVGESDPNLDAPVEDSDTGEGDELVEDEESDNPADPPTQEDSEDELVEDEESDNPAEKETPHEEDSPKEEGPKILEENKSPTQEIEEDTITSTKESAEEARKAAVEAIKDLEKQKGRQTSQTEIVQSSEGSNKEKGAVEPSEKSNKKDFSLVRAVKGGFNVVKAGLKIPVVVTVGTTESLGAVLKGKPGEGLGKLIETVGDTIDQSLVTAGEAINILSNKKVEEKEPYQPREYISPGPIMSAEEVADLERQRQEESEERQKQRQEEYEKWRQENSFDEPPLEETPLTEEEQKIADTIREQTSGEIDITSKEQLDIFESFSIKVDSEPEQSSEDYWKGVDKDLDKYYEGVEKYEGDIEERQRSGIPELIEGFGRIYDALSNLGSR